MSKLPKVISITEVNPRSYSKTRHFIGMERGTQVDEYRKSYIRKDIADKLAESLRNMMKIRRGDGGTILMPDQVVENLLSQYEALNDQ